MKTRPRLATINVLQLNIYNFGKLLTVPPPKKKMTALTPYFSFRYPRGKKHRKYLYNTNY